jgi:hypothetical protein
VPPPATLNDYYTQVKTDADTAVTSLQATVATANADLAAAQQALNDANKNLASDQAANAALRTALSQANLPSDATALVGQLQQNLIQIWKDQAAVGDAIDKAAAATRAQQDAVAELAAAQQAQQQATTDLATSQDNDKKIANWTTAVTAAAVTDALTAVNDPSVATSVTNAAGVLEAIIGNGMLNLFHDRWDNFQAAQTALGDAVTTALNAQTALLNAQEPLAGAVNRAKAGYDADVGQLNDLAANAAADISAAQAALTSAANVGVLSDAEQQPLTAATAAARAQVAAEKAVFDAKAQLRKDQAALDLKTLTAYQTNPDFDPSTDPLTATTEADEAALATAQATLANGQADLDRWQVDIPREVTDLVVGFVKAEATVTKYQAVDVNGLLADLTAKEAVYAGALAALRTYQQSGALIAKLLASRQGDAAAAAQVMQARGAAAILGAQ